MIPEQLLPGWAWMLQNQHSVLWIYLGIFACLSTRIWLTIYSLMLLKDQRQPFLSQANGLSELTVNVPVLLGVLGTIVGVAMAATSTSDNGTPESFLVNFNKSFGVAVCTTVTGGLTHIVCFLISAFDDRLGNSK